MQKIIYAIPLIFVLLTGFSRSSLSCNVFAQNYLDVSTSVNSLYADQMTPEEKRKQQARDQLEEELLTAICSELINDVEDEVKEDIVEDLA